MNKINDYKTKSAWFFPVALVLAALFLTPPITRARTITASIEFTRQQFSTINPYYFGQTYFTIGVRVASDIAPVTYDEVSSPGPSPVFTGTESGYSQTLFSDLGSMLDAVTNGVWTLTVNKGDVTEKQYTFTVSANGVDGTNFPAVQVATPADGSPAVSTNTSFSWSGPGTWDELEVVDHNLDYSFYVSDSPSPDATSWTSAPALPLGTNLFEITYKTNGAPWLAVSTPVDSLSQPFTNWAGGAKLVDFVQSGFVTSTNPAATGGTIHTLVAHYAFDDTSTDTFQLGLDSSPNDNSMGGYGYWGEVHTNRTDAVAGGGAVEFFGTSEMDAHGRVLTNLNAVLAGSFTFSTRVKTTDIRGNDYDNAYFGATIFWAFNDHNATNDAIPLAITGGKAAFTTRDHLGNFNTLHSVSSVNDGVYHLITVTRDQATGEKKIYVDGRFEASEIGTTEPLNGNDYFLSIGGTTSSSYTGLLDDLQIYRGVLSASEVQQIYKAPGTTVPDATGVGPRAHYDFDEGTALAADVSGNGNDLVYSGNFGGSGPVTNADAIAGTGSVEFDGGSYLTAPAGLLPALAGSFSVSVWVNTVQDAVNNQNNSDAAGIVAADVPGNFNDVIPIGVDEHGEVVFNTGNPDQGYDDEMYSWNYVNDGSWHHIVVTRDQASGAKNIYIDGVLDDGSPEYGTTNLLNDPVLLTIGALADASNPDPASPDSTGDNGYAGLLDDLQIYPRVLSANEVAYLYANPGSNLVAVPKPPVDAAFSISIVRNQTIEGTDEYYCFPRLDSVSVPAITRHSVESPNGWFNGSLTGGGSISQLSLGDVLNECTNGLWKLYINKGDLSEQVFTFQVQISGLDTNLLQPVMINSPVNGSSNISINPTFTWTGPAGFDGIFVQTYRPEPPNNYVSTNMPGTATNWPSPPMLQAGTNRFYLSYHTNDVPFITTSMPVDGSATPINGWSSTGHVNSDATAQFAVTSRPASVQLVNLQHVGNSIQFSFLAELNRTNIIESRTNLSLGSWIPLTNFVGDGATQQFSFPITNAPAQFFRVNTQ